MRAQIGGQSREVIVSQGSSVVRGQVYSYDVGRPITGVGIPAGTQIVEWVSAGAALMSNEATFDG